MTAVQLHIIQMNLEGLRLSEDGHLERWKDMPGGESGPPPLMVAADYGEMFATYFASGVDSETEAALRALPGRALVDGEPIVYEILGRQRPDLQQEQSWTYTVTSSDSVQYGCQAVRTPSTDERLRGLDDGFYGVPYDVFAVVNDGIVASAATSSREDATAAECWIYTRPEYRRRGYAVAAALAWIDHATQRGLVPFYSHVRGNDASRRLACSLPLRLCFVLSCYK